MLWKFLVISVLGITLIGCGEDEQFTNERKVTADMLVGEWKCELVISSQKKYNSETKLISESEGKNYVPFFLIYKLNSDKISEYYLDENFYNHGEYLEYMDERYVLDKNEIPRFESNWSVDDYGDDIKEVLEWNYISDNKFQKIYKDKVMSIINYSTTDNYSESTCTRVK